MENIRIPITGAIKRSVDSSTWNIHRDSVSTAVRYAVWVDLWDRLEFVEDIWRTVTPKKI